MDRRTDEHRSFLLYIYFTLFAPKSSVSKYIVGGTHVYLDCIALL